MSSRSEARPSGAPRGGSFLVEARGPSEVFTPEDFSQAADRTVGLSRYPI
jgi:hypothetical protein